MRGAWMSAKLGADRSMAYANRVPPPCHVTRTAWPFLHSLSCFLPLVIFPIFSTFFPHFLAFLFLSSVSSSELRYFRRVFLKYFLHQRIEIDNCSIDRLLKAKWPATAAPPLGVLGNSTNDLQCCQSASLILESPLDWKTFRRIMNNMAV